MKRIVALFLTLMMLLSLPAAVLAADRHHDRHYDPGDRRDAQYHHRDNDPGPLKWREHRRGFDGHHLRPIHDRNLEHRYPGLHGYKWNGHGDNHRGFWHNGHYVNDGIVFFDREERMAGFGYMANGAFVFVDENGYREDREDLFFLMLLFKLLEARD